MSGVMNALIIDSPGPNQVPRIEQVPVPVPGPGQLLIRVQAAALNPLDLKIASGQVGLRRSPNILGFDAAGSVDALGDGVERYRVGDLVLALTITNGSLAEYVVVDVGPYVAPIPRGLTVETAAALPSAGASAAALVEAAAPRPGENVLVIGASGGLGTFAVQLTARAGARVLATGRNEDRDLLRTLGAAEAIDYRAQPLPESVLGLAPSGVDVLIDLANTGPELAAAAEMVRDGGRVVSPLGGPDALPRGVIVSYPPIHPLPVDRLSRLAADAVEGKLTVTTDIRGTMADAEKVLAQYDSAHRRGKWILVAS
jgi:NADPH2:quinone reductase